MITLLMKHEEVINNACLNRDGQQAVTANRDATVLVWDATVPRHSQSRDFELKNGFGFYLQGFIAGARFEPTTTQR